MSIARDWSVLPASQHQFIPLFEKYGVIQFESMIMSKIDTMTPSEHKEIRQLIDGIDEDVLNAFIDNHPMTENECSRLVYFTLHFLAIGRDSGGF